MVDKISRISATSASAATRVETSISLAEPDIAWVAERQSAINAAVSEHVNMRHPSEPNPSDEDGRSDDASARHLDLCSSQKQDDEDGERLSGESERIGTGNLDDDSPFGDHVGFV
jgi:hypothetical protein